MNVHPAMPLAIALIGIVLGGWYAFGVMPAFYCLLTGFLGIFTGLLVERYHT